MVEPSLAMRMKISPGGAVGVEADGDVAFVAADAELVGDGGALGGETVADGAGWGLGVERVGVLGGGGDDGGELGLGVGELLRLGGEAGLGELRRR